jgi:VanZ family protein
MRALAAAWIVIWALASIPWTSATTHGQWSRVRPPRLGTMHLRADHVLNFLYYVPVAPIGAALGGPLPALVVAGGLMSATAEAAQVFSHGRNPDANDVIINVGGTVAGAALVYLVRRRRARGAR